jgi:hypothetical protein
MLRGHVFSGKLDRSANGLVLHADGGHDIVLRSVAGIDSMIGNHVVVVGIVNEDKSINAFRIEPDDSEQTN